MAKLAIICNKYTIYLHNVQENHQRNKSTAFHMVWKMWKAPLHSNDMNNFMINLENVNTVDSNKE